jgi:hypothetical protein
MGYWISYSYQTCVFLAHAKVLLGVFHDYHMFCLFAPTINKQKIYEFSAVQGYTKISPQPSLVFILNKSHLDCLTTQGLVKRWTYIIIPVGT